MNHHRPQPEQILQETFGYSSFRPGQRELIEAQLQGRDVLGVMPTGGGKSICYQLTALMQPGITLVVSPLISLMVDQVQALVQLGVRAAYLNSSLSPKQLERALDNACRGVYKIIYLAPERLNTQSIRRLVDEQDISLLCVDEAHCVSQWGQDFRPSYLEIPRFLQSLPKRPVVAAFTATATPRVREDIVNLIGLRSPLITVTGFDRPNLYFEVQRPPEKFDALVACIEQFPEKSGIIYCLTRKKVEDVQEKLARIGYRVARYHAGLTQEERRESQEDFLYDRVQLVVATNAFGMGIDKSNVSFVIHYNMPKDLESYYQEAGRAGRDGSPASCILLYSGGDTSLNRYMIDQDPEEDTMEPKMRAELRKLEHQRLNQMVAYSTGTRCLRTAFLTYFGERTTADCGNCSNCRAKAAPVRATSIPRKSRREDRLMVALVAERARLSRRNGVAPSNIFSDLTLFEMARERPENEFQLLQISGVTLAKCRRYGRAFLRVIAKQTQEERQEAP